MNIEKSTIVMNIEKTLSKRYCTLMKNKHRWKGISTLPTHLFQRPKKQIEPYQLNMFFKILTA